MRLAPLRSTCVYLNNNARYDRPKISHELQVNVPRTMGILRDVMPFLKNPSAANQWLVDYANIIYWNQCLSELIPISITQLAD